MENKKMCRCLAPIEAPKFFSYIGTGGVCLYASGATVEDAVERGRQHAKVHGIPPHDWVEMWVENAAGEVVKEVKSRGW